MKSSVLHAPGSSRHVPVRLIGAALWLAVGLPGGFSGAADLEFETPEWRVGSEPYVVRATNALESSFQLLPTNNPPLRTDWEPAVAETNVAPQSLTNEPSSTLGPVETISTGLQLITNLQVEREHFQQTLDGLRRQLEAGSARHAQTVVNGLSLIEPTLVRHQSESLEALRKLNQTTLLAVCGFGAIVLVGIFAAVFMLTRGLNRFAELVASTRQPAGVLSPGYALPGLGSGHPYPAVPGPVDEATARFLGAIDRLEHRIRELEQTAQPQPNAVDPHQTSAGLITPGERTGRRQERGDVRSMLTEHTSGVTQAACSQSAVLMGKGEALLNLGQPEQALECFEEVLSSDPANAEVLVRKGLALEQMHRLEEALQTYSQALDLDNSITAAYLHKGGVCSQLQRHSEALECFQKALRTESK